MHALLVAAAALVGWPWPVRLLAALAVVLHGRLRRPRGAPESIAVAADGACRVPAGGEEWHRPGPGTRVAPFWLRIDLPTPAGRLDILLLADQLEYHDWARLTARLCRVAAPQPRAPRDRSPAAPPNLR